MRARRGGSPPRLQEGCCRCVRSRRPSRARSAPRRPCSAFLPSALHDAATGVVAVAQRAAGDVTGADDPLAGLGGRGVRRARLGGRGGRLGLDVERGRAGTGRSTSPVSSTHVEELRVALAQVDRLAGRRARLAAAVALGVDAAVDHEHGALAAVLDAQVDEDGLVGRGQRLEALDAVCAPARRRSAEADRERVQRVRLAWASGAGVPRACGGAGCRRRGAPPRRRTARRTVTGVVVRSGSVSRGAVGLGSWPSRGGLERVLARAEHAPAARPRSALASATIGSPRPRPVGASCAAPARRRRPAGSGSLASRNGTAASAATSRSATGHSRRRTSWRQVSVTKLIGWLPWWSRWWSGASWSSRRRSGSPARRRARRGGAAGHALGGGHAGRSWRRSRRVICGKPLSSGLSARLSSAQQPAGDVDLVVAHA